MHRLRRQFGSSGFTLAEMVVVLIILAALTMIAVESTHSLAVKAKFESTKTTLENIKKAILCVEPSANGASTVRGFFVDMGRLPNPAIAAPLHELLAKPIHPDHPSDEEYYNFEVQSTELGAMGSGWNGPYLRLPPGHTGFLDGWNHPILYEYNPAADPRAGDPAGSAYVPTVPPEPIVRIRSLGADGVADSEVAPVGPFDGDIEVYLYATDLYATSLTFRAYELDAMGIEPADVSGHSLWLKVFRINPDNANYERVDCATEAIAGTSIYETSRPPPIEDEDPPKSFVRVGKIAVQAIKRVGADVTGSVASQGAPRIITVLPASVETHTFVLPATPSGEPGEPEPE